MRRVLSFTTILLLYHLFKPLAKNGDNTKHFYPEISGNRIFMIIFFNLFFAEFTFRSVRVMTIIIFHKFGILTLIGIPNTLLTSSKKRILNVYCVSKSQVKKVKPDAATPP